MREVRSTNFSDRNSRGLRDRKFVLLLTALALLTAFIAPAIATSATAPAPRATVATTHRHRARHRRRHHRRPVAVAARASTNKHRTTTTTTTSTTATTTTSTSTTTATTSTPSGSGPSGQSMPVGDITGWHQVFADDFSGSALDTSRWRAYGGQPGGDPGGWWDPRHVLEGNGMLVLAGYRDSADGGKWTTGGVSSSPGLAQTYGKYLVRFRFDNGQGIAHVLLLWPADDSWPPEIDFSEDNAQNHQTDFGTLHYGANNTQIQNSTSVDLSQWHTLGVEWTPGRLVYTIDGRVWATTANTNVPSTPMVLDMQTQAWACGTNSWEGCVGSTTPAQVNMDVDWAVAYSPAT